MRNRSPAGGSFEDYSAQNIPTAERRKSKLFLLFKIKRPQYTFFTPAWFFWRGPWLLRKCGSASAPIGVQSMSLFLSDPGSFTHSCLVHLTDATLAFEDSNSKLFDIVSVADVDAEERVDDSLDEIFGAEVW